MGASQAFSVTGPGCLDRFDGMHAATDQPALVSIAVGDAPQVWERLGFVVADGATVVGGVRIDLGSEGHGVRSWTFSGIDAGPIVDGRLDGLRTTVVDAIGTTAISPDHPNGIVSIDHVVVATPDHTRTLAALSATGLELRRDDVHHVDTYGTPVMQAFYRPCGAILEIIGPEDAAPDAGKAGFYGLAFTSEDLEATAAYLGAALKPAKDAVQPGRRIATVASSAGATVPIAIMSRHPRADSL